MIIDAYICYASSEKRHAGMLADTLAAIETAGALTLHWDRDATAGSRFTDAVRDRLDEADVVVLLISKTFLRSNFCQDQLNHAIERGMLVVPVVLESCDWIKTAARQSDFLPSDSNPVSTWKNKADAFVDIAEGVVAACERYSLGVERWTEALGEEEKAIMTRLSRTADWMASTFGTPGTP